MAKIKKLIENLSLKIDKLNLIMNWVRNFEAGISLLGWEVKSIRSSRVDIKDSYILMKKGEAWIIGMSISPLKK